MEYNKLSKSKLIQMILELKTLNEQLLDEKKQDETLNYSWTGNLGHWYWNFKSNIVTFNPLKITALGYTKEEIPPVVNYQYFTDRLHPEDYERTMDAMRSHLIGTSKVYEVEYRIRAKDGSYKWYYDRGKITKYDENGNPELLAGIVFDVTEKHEMLSELQEKNEKLIELATKDSLTHLLNHHTLIEKLSEAINIAKQKNEPLTIAIFDIDDFKRVNDQFGHVTGDKVLIELSKIISDCISSNHIAGRYGGEEFMIVFKNTDVTTACSLSNKIRVQVENHCFCGDKHITISGGVKNFTNETITDLIQLADTFLYEAKRTGKNKIVGCI